MEDFALSTKVMHRLCCAKPFPLLPDSRLPDDLTRFGDLTPLGDSILGADLNLFVPWRHVNN